MTRLALLALLLAPARAEVPLPLQPGCGAEDRPDLCPPDLGEEWSLISYVPAGSRDSVRPAELELGSGVSADRAWRTTTGRFDVVLAVADSGIEWNNSQLVNKVWLNQAELPLPEGPGGDKGTYDYDGNGVFNVQDYALDLRVSWTAGRDAADAMLDPSDLIYTFSNGADEDANGYVDDIAGWDFFGRDNDAWNDFDDGYGTHGSGVMEEAAAEGGQSSDGTIGVCPSCAILPVRIGDTFITDGTRVAEGVGFAVDSGAAVINLATGALSSPGLTREAIDYALDMGVPVVAAAGDENAYHDNFPAMLDGTLYVHSIRHDSSNGDAGTYSYMNTWNCNNYGPRLTLVAPSSACATGSCAVTTGVIGLMQSAARDAGVTLSAGEVTQILIGTADDVWLTEDERAEAEAYPSDEGWDPFYGYGRINAEQAVRAVVTGDIPPVPTLLSPRWFDYVSIDDVEAGIAIEGRLSALRSAGYTWNLSFGRGVNPTEWVHVADGSGSFSSEGVLGTLKPAMLGESMLEEVGAADPDEGILERLDRVYRPAVTLRLEITDAEGRRGEDRKTFFVQRDPDLRPGFPLVLGASAESSPVLEDLDGDGALEVLLGLSDGRVLAIDGAGEPLPGWPVQVEPLDDASVGAASYETGAMSPDVPDGILSTVAAGDLDGDGELEVVAATGRGGLYAWHADGSLVDGFPAWTLGRAPEEFDTEHTYDQGFAGAPTLYDLDGDGALEIVVLGLDSRLYVFGADGADWGPYPIEICHPENCGITGSRIVSSPTIGDVDADGDPDIGFGTNETLDDGSAALSFLLDANTGVSLDGWPVESKGALGTVELLPLIGSGHPASMAFADIDGDGDLEIANPIMLGLGDVLDHTGETALDLSFTQKNFGAGTDAPNVTGLLQLMSNPAWGDMDGDGTLDLILGGSSTDYLLTVPLSQWVDFQQAVGGWNGATGTMLPGWPRQVEDLQFLMAPAIADLDGDRQPEAIYGSAGYLLHAWNADGEQPTGWPKFTGQWLIGSPAVGDIDGDGYFDVVVASREGYLFAWSTRGPADGPLEWASIHHDARNTGNYGEPLPTQAGPEVRVASGCCDDEGDGAWLLLPAALGLGLRRRRRV